MAQTLFPIERKKGKILIFIETVDTNKKINILNSLYSSAEKFVSSFWRKNPFHSLELSAFLHIHYLKGPTEWASEKLFSFNVSFISRRLSSINNDNRGEEKGSEPVEKMI